MKTHFLANRKATTLVEKVFFFLFFFFWALKSVVGMTGFIHFQGECAVRKNLGLERLSRDSV